MAQTAQSRRCDRDARFLAGDGDRARAAAPPPVWRRAIAIRRGVLPAFAAVAILAAITARGEESRPRSIIHLGGPEYGLAETLDVLCPADEFGEPQFESRLTGRVRAIADPQLRAVAKEACRSSEAASQTSGAVEIANQTASTLYVGFTPQAGSRITWGAGCLAPIRGLTVKVLAGSTCLASVTDSVANPGSRFCAATNIGPAGLDCSKAQQDRLTLVEPYFEPAPCFGRGSANCIWYDISVIPSYCTDDTPFGSKRSDWESDACAATGGASYNLPVMVGCRGAMPEPTFICRGPAFATGKYAAAGYPSHCGNPAGSCIDGAQQQCTNGVEAYFYPMSVINAKHQPAGACPGGQTLTITFLAGP